MVQTYTIQSDFVQIFKEKYVDLEGFRGLAGIWDFLKTRFQLLHQKWELIIGGAANLELKYIFKVYSLIVLEHEKFLHFLGLIKIFAL